MKTTALNPTEVLTPLIGSFITEHGSDDAFTVKRWQLNGFRVTGDHELEVMIHDVLSDEATESHVLWIYEGLELAAQYLGRLGFYDAGWKITFPLAGRLS